MNVIARGVASGLLRWLVGAREGPGGEVDPARFHVPVKDPGCTARIRGILTAFFDGFERGLKDPETISAAGRDVPALLRPFFHEGAAMGFLPRGYLQLRSSRRSIEALESSFGPDDPFLFLRYVGLGFWLGFDFPQWGSRLAARLGFMRRAKYRALVYDGLGFKRGFFDSPRIAPEALRKEPSAAAALGIECLQRLEGSARRSAMNGFGRSLWFLFMDRPACGAEVARALEGDAPWVLGGLGLAAAFTFVDDLSRAYALADQLVPEERAHVVKGLRIALYVRHRSDPEHLETSFASLPAALQPRARQDLAHALAVGGRTEDREDFIDAFHAGCLVDP